MSDSVKGLTIRTGVLEDLSSGSYEERLSTIASAVEQSDLFGEEKVLLATFENHVVVVNESGEFFKSIYRVSEDGSVRFLQSESMNVPVIFDEDISRGVVSNFYEGNSMVGGMMEMLRGSFYREATPMDKVTESVKSLFGRDSLWRNYIRENKDRLMKTAFDPAMGSPRIDTGPSFDHLYGNDVSEDVLEGHRQDVLFGLVKLEGRLTRLYTQATEAYEKYQRSVSGTRDEEAAQVLARYEAFTNDYLESLSSVGGFISESIRAGKTGCVACGALVHDEVARGIVEMEMAERLIRKVSVEIASS